MTAVGPTEAVDPVTAAEPRTWTGLPVLVVGVGVSGLAAARALLGRGARVRVVDAGDTERHRAAAADLRALGATVELGGLPADPGGAGLVVTSPGVPPTAPLIIGSAAAGVPVWGRSSSPGAGAAPPAGSP